MSDNLAWRRQAGPDDWRTRRRTCARQCGRRLAGPRQLPLKNRRHL